MTRPESSGVLPRRATALALFAMFVSMLAVSAPVLAEDTPLERTRHVALRVGFGADHSFIYERPFAFGASIAVGVRARRLPLAVDGELSGYLGQSFTEVHSRITQVLPWLSLVVASPRRVSLRPGIGVGLELWRVAGPSVAIVEVSPTIAARVEGRVELAGRWFAAIDVRMTAGFNPRYPDVLLSTSIFVGAGVGF